MAVDDRRANDVWPVIERLYLSLTDRAPFNHADWAVPKRPATTPWLATVYFDYPKVPDNIHWFRELQGAMAWAWLQFREWQ